MMAQQRRINSARTVGTVKPCVDAQPQRACSEEMPVTRYVCAVPRSAAPADQDWGAIRALLERQNALLCDILCALNGLAASNLARRS